MADNANLKGQQNGYYIRLGENGSFDSVDLWEQSGNKSTKIIDGVSGHCSKSSNTLRIKVSRNLFGDWEIFSDTLGGWAFSSEGKVKNNAHTSGSFFGILCNFTSSNSTKFYFDDFIVGPKDTIPPVLKSLQVVTSNSLDLTFNEAVSMNSAQNANNYFVGNGIGNPSTAALDVADFSKVRLNFPLIFGSGIKQLIVIDNLIDLSNNKMPAA